MTTSSLETVASNEAPNTAATSNGFTNLGLSPALLKALAETGYTTPTPIQAKAIPPLLQGRDLLGLAETGTGKTAAFALPLIQRLVAENKQVTSRHCRALILAPTRELAIQIAESVVTYGKHTTLTHTVIFGGVGSRPQMKAMDRGVDIVIATPGRLLDLISTRNINLGEVTHFVLDEADRMLDMGFIHDVQKIVRGLPKQRQSLLFSATMPNDIASLAAQLLSNPQRVEVARAGKTVDRIAQKVHFVDAKAKRAALVALLQDENMQRVIAFTRTKRGANRVADTLDIAGIPAVAIHGNKSQNARQAALEAFRNGKARVLVATDIAARGIDIDDITHVINYELPNVPESYVHRIGRTARAGAEGVAIALCAPDEKPYLRDIERLTKVALIDAGKVAGIEAFASMPEPKKRRHDDDEDRPHFDRRAGKVDHNRRNNRPYETRVEAPRTDKRDDRGQDRGQRSDASRGDRPQFSRGAPGDTRGDARSSGARSDARPSGARSDGHPSGARSDARGDRAPRPFGDKPRFDRGTRPAGGSDRGPRPEGRSFDRPRDGQRSGDRKPFGGDRNNDRGGDRPRGDFNRDRGPRPDARTDNAAPTSAGGFDPLNANTRRDKPDPVIAQARNEYREQRSDTRGAPAGDRASRPPNRGGDRPAWRRDDNSAGATGGDRRDSAPRGDAKPWQRREGGDRPQGNRGDGAGAKPWQSRNSGDSRDRGSERGGDRGGYRGNKPAGDRRPSGDFKPRSENNRPGDGMAPRGRAKDTSGSV